MNNLMEYKKLCHFLGTLILFSPTLLPFLLPKYSQYVNDTIDINIIGALKMQNNYGAFIFQYCDSLKKDNYTESNTKRSH